MDGSDERLADVLRKTLREVHVILCAHMKDKDADQVVREIAQLLPNLITGVVKDVMPGASALPAAE